MQLLEANMRLKLSGPDYRDKDPLKSLQDFRQRVKAYESAYEPLGKHEEDNDLQYVQVRNREHGIFTTRWLGSNCLRAIDDRCRQKGDPS